MLCSIILPFQIPYFWLCTCQTRYRIAGGHKWKEFVTKSYKKPFMQVLATREHTDIIWEEFMSTSHFKDQLVFECSAESAWEKYYTIHADKNNWCKLQYYLKWVLLWYIIIIILSANNYSQTSKMKWSSLPVTSEFSRTSLYPYEILYQL